MNILNRYKDPSLAQNLLDEIHKIRIGPVKFMEVCGGHTQAIQRFGIGNLLPNQIKLISGPGCPVCVTEIDYIDKALAYADNEEHIIATYGDLIRVPGTSSTLELARAESKNIVVVQSPLDVLAIAVNQPDKKVIFLGIGFETTTPGSGLLIKKAREQQLNNVFLLSAHKIMPPAMDFLLQDQVRIHGFIAPGHVSVIAGSAMYLPVVKKHGIPVVISGFEAVDILQSVYMLVKQIHDQEPKVENQYKRAVHANGNEKAISLMEETFQKSPAKWRGLGELDNSGLRLKDKFADYDIEKVLPVSTFSAEPKGCICGEILKGMRSPHDCGLFASACTPSSPVGACMVSPEGACQAHYSYAEHE